MRARTSKSEGPLPEPISGDPEATGWGSQDTPPVRGGRNPACSEGGIAAPRARRETSDRVTVDDAF